MMKTPWCSMMSWASLETSTATAVLYWEGICGGGEDCAAAGCEVFASRVRSADAGVIPSLFSTPGAPTVALATLSRARRVSSASFSEIVVPVFHRKISWTRLSIVRSCCLINSGVARVVLPDTDRRGGALSRPTSSPYALLGVSCSRDLCC